MHGILGSLVALALAQPAGNPRAIDPAANRPEIVAPGGTPAKVRPPKTRPPKVEPKPEPKVEPKPEPKVEPKPEPKVEPKPEPKVEPKPEPKPEPKVEPKPEPKVEPKIEPKVEPKPEPKVEPTTVVDDGTDQGPADRCFPAKGRCWRLNVAGIAAASVGVGMLGTGIGFIKAPTWPAPTGPNEPIFDRSLRPPGVVLVALGSVTVVTGVLMIVAGHATHGKPRTNKRTARVRVVPGGLRW